jgi:MFS family permease
VVNAYMVTYGGFLLLGGRLGDLYGQRRWFLFGTALFTVASLVCALANTQWLLVVARAVQGLGGAAVSAIALSLIMNLFTEAGERAKAMGSTASSAPAAAVSACLQAACSPARSAGTGCSWSTCRSARWSVLSASRCSRQMSRLRRSAASMSPAPSR